MTPDPTTSASATGGREQGASAGDRVRDLVARMTPTEKVGQVMLLSTTQITGPPGEDRGPIDPEQLERVVGGLAVGGLLSGGGHAPAHNHPRDWAEMIGTFQRHAAENTRLGIPLLYGVDAVHGHNNVVGATIFPHNIGLAASFDPDLVERTAAATGRAARATGTNWVYAPVADLGRDPRWGRFYETFGESPWLAGELAAAAVRGLQGGDPAAPDRAAATVKHFLGYGAAVSGLDRTDAQLPRRTLRDRYLPPFEVALRADALSVMVNSGSVNGVPAHASRTLLTDILRGELGFDGVIVSDWADIEMLASDYEVAPDLGGAIARAFDAGVDMAMIPSDGIAFAAAMAQLLDDGRLTEERLDASVERILRMKESLGLFDAPPIDVEAAPVAVLDRDRELAREAASACVVLLRDRDGLLPLDGDPQVLVTGPGADQLSWQMGGWTIRWQGDPRPGEQPPAVTVADALRARLGDRVQVVPGTPISADGEPDEVDRLRQDAVTAAADADIVVAVVGEPSGAELPADHPTADLRSDQVALLTELAATGTPVATVIIAGRPLVLGAAAEVDTLVMAHLPGTEAGTAIADVLLGERSPGGRLPYSWPRHSGQIPIAHDVLPGAQGDGPFALATRGGQYDPRFAFGHGLATTTFEVTGIATDADHATPHGTLLVRATVTNTGPRPGAHVLPVFLLQHVAAVVRPYRTLVGWARADLEPGTSAEVVASIPIERFAVTTGDIEGEGERRVLPGRYTLDVDGHATVEIEVADA